MIRLNKYKQNLTIHNNEVWSYSTYVADQYDLDLVKDYQNY